MNIPPLSPCPSITQYQGSRSLIFEYRRCRNDRTKFRVYSFCISSLSFFPPVFICGIRNYGTRGYGSFYRTFVLLNFRPIYNLATTIYFIKFYRNFVDTRLPSLSRNHMGLSENIVASNSKRLLGSFPVGSFPVQIAIWIHLGGIPIFRQSLKLGSMRMVANYTFHHIPLYI